MHTAPTPAAPDWPDQVAATIVDGFDNYRQQFQAITLGARSRFDRADWQAVHAAAGERIRLYKRFSAATLARVREALDGIDHGVDDWGRVKAAYIPLISHRADFDLAETVFNTMFRKMFPGADVDDRHAFLRTVFDEPPVRSVLPVYRTYRVRDTLRTLFADILTDYPFAAEYEDRRRDIDNMVAALLDHVRTIDDTDHITIDLVRSVFFRNKGAYLVGRLHIDGRTLPLAIPILVGRSGKCYVDTMLLDEDELSILFSFTRSWFMVEANHPYELVSFLKQLLPGKKISELYASLGFDKHGRTLFMRGFIEHLEHSDDQFVIAEGIKGMVMSVFTLPSYQVAFKIIKDKFSPTKQVTREQVRAAYHLVKTHDRVGRMADTQEFSNFRFPRARFAESLIAELQQVAASSLILNDDSVIIRSLYTERLMTPLNLYIQTCDDTRLHEVMDEYGNAIKQLAGANIFPGDMLLKNFGVTRHGRVVFYDYDEICYLTSVNFRDIPPPRYPEDELNAEPWYSVGPNDIFPEEFPRFLMHSPRLREVFTHLHGDLFEAGWWRDLQRKIADGKVLDVFPYRRRRRFERG